ncbi:caspase family protein [Streptomyces sp. NBC_01429]|uniref:caspase family protein n=1 Tax=Streptomyces sp. NBC_01429 TaxID=2903862 RepID=UPI002E2852C1|nr:caspase family protein [Streptomyces sp. NBC_01429]
MSEQRRYRGLLIGNATYVRDPHALPAIDGPLTDIEELSLALTDPEVGLFNPADLAALANCGIQELRERVDELFTTASREDVLLLYYSGHGQLDERGTLYLGATDTRTGALRATALSAIEINNIIDGSPAGTTILILDCCYSGAFKSTAPALLAEGRGRYVLTSSRSTQLTQAAIGFGHPSPFTQRLVQVLRTVQPTGSSQYLTLSETYQHVHDRMTVDTVITPQLNFRGEGDVAIARRQTQSDLEPPRKGEEAREPQSFPAAVEPGAPVSDSTLDEGKKRGSRRFLPWVGSVFTAAVVVWSSYLGWKSMEGEKWIDKSQLVVMPPLVFFAIVRLDFDYRRRGISLPRYSYILSSIVVSLGPLLYAWQVTDGRGLLVKAYGVAMLLMPISFVPYLFRGMVVDILCPELHPDVKRMIQAKRREAFISEKRDAEEAYLADSLRRYREIEEE